MFERLGNAATYIYGLLLTASGHGQLQSIISDYTPQGRICSGCVPREQIVAPGVGIDLTTTYGTVAIRYHNKTIVDVGRLDGSEEYKALMKKLSPPWVRQGPPFDDIRDQIRWEYEQAQRKIRQARGLPSTTDIETLSEFLWQLHHMASCSADVDIGNNVFFSTAQMPNLPYGDFQEALEFANLTQHLGYRFRYGAPNQITTGFVGMGYGLCEHWADPAKCSEEENGLPPKKLITISYTDEELYVSTAWAQTASWVSPDLLERYPEFGYNSTSQHSDEFWTGIKQRITTVMRATDTKPDTLILLGDRAKEKKFADTVWEALGELGIVDIYRQVQVSGFDAEMLNARGAAELAKRAQGEPQGCIEGDWCAGNRVPGEDGTSMPEEIEADIGTVKCQAVGCDKPELL